MYNLFLTGDKGVGKTTILYSLIERIYSSIGGYMTSREFDGNEKVFKLLSLLDGIEEIPIAKVYCYGDSRNFYVSDEAFEIQAVSLLERSLLSREVIVIDELGFMESKLPNFKKEVIKILDSDKIVIGVIKNHNNDFLNSIKERSDVRIIEVTSENKNELLECLVEILVEFGCLIKKPSLIWDKKRVRWHREALECSHNDYPNMFLKEIYKYWDTISGKSVLDVGAGTGAFTLPLLEGGARLTALDSSINMLNALKLRLDNKGLKNIKYILSPFEQAKLEIHDIVISAFSYGSTSSITTLDKLCKLARELVFIIAPTNNINNNFLGDILLKKLNRSPKYFNNACKDTTILLRELGYDFIDKQIEYDFPQYFLNFDDAIDFFMIHFQIENDVDLKVLEEFLNKYLIKLDTGYLLKNSKLAQLIIVKK